MARRKKGEDEHINHEAWAIPYADMLVLLLAFFVVMYSISSVNEGKYRVLSNSLAAAFRGQPMTVEPVQFGERQRATGESALEMDIISDPVDFPTHSDGSQVDPADAMREGLDEIADAMREAMAPLIDEDLVEVRGSEFYIEIEIKADILFPSGSADLSQAARPVLGRVAEVLEPFPNPIQVEGHTDNVPIETDRFPSNWELSAARAASVVHLFRDQGIQPMRLAVVGLGEYRPVASNETPEGRNRNRRVVLTVLADPRFQERWFSPENAEGLTDPSDMQQMLEPLESIEDGAGDGDLPEDLFPDQQAEGEQP
ncbi:chemotaxis protein MotB [Natronospira proteinivora]|uniref:Chemotaxis protein MotB n=1 Tax=Natronospira proteinivora TaxID=1807133 RepID=A0ABT1G816_9GAMM|nr:flagellar motor protein MotD [Natronospira proteinivora]MCP1726458.1 chemotaxis protein MotB [Natronospira proteinivora]